MQDLASELSLASGGRTVREAARMLGLTEAQVRSFVRDRLVKPARGARGEARFSFEDLVILRMAAALEEEGVPASNVRRALKKLGKAPLGIRLEALGRSVVLVGEEAPPVTVDTGQSCFPFVAGTHEGLSLASGVSEHDDQGATADELYDQACALEVSSRVEAESLYRRALALDPSHSDAHTNLGRLLHAGGDAKAAETHYRIALEKNPDDPTALFDLAVALEDQGRADEAIELYERVLEIAPDFVDADYNLARLYELQGERAGALRHLAAYRRAVGRG